MEISQKIAGGLEDTKKDINTIFLYHRIYEHINMSTKENDNDAPVLPKAPRLKNNASYWFGKGSSSNQHIELGDHDEADLKSLEELRLIEKSKPHFIFVVDATGSMRNFTSSMKSTLKQVITVMNVLYSGHAQVSVVAYVLLLGITRKFLKQPDVLCTQNILRYSNKEFDFALKLYITFNYRYYDYSDFKVIKSLHARHASDMEKLIRFVNRLDAAGGGDWPEAAKTGFCAVLRNLITYDPDIHDKNSNKIVIHYTGTLQNKL